MSVLSLAVPLAWEGELGGLKLIGGIWGGSHPIYGTDYASVSNRLARIVCSPCEFYTGSTYLNEYNPVIALFLTSI